LVAGKTLYPKGVRAISDGRRVQLFYNDHIKPDEADQDYFGLRGHVPIAQEINYSNSSLRRKILARMNENPHKTDPIIIEIDETNKQRRILVY